MTSLYHFLVECRSSCRHFVRSHGVQSIYPARFSRRADGVWCFDDRVWSSMYFFCSPLEFVRWFWCVGRLLGKIPLAYSSYSFTFCITEYALHFDLYIRAREVI